MGNWDDFLEDATAYTVRKAKCSVCLLLKELPEDATEKVTEVMAKEELTSTAIQHALANRLGDKVPAAATINRHRRGNCRGLA